MPHSVFVPTLREPKPGFDVKTLLKKKTAFGDIGLEIECEGNIFNKNNATLAPWWCYHEDHSLRGNDNAEYVLIDPIQFKEVPEALDFLWDIFTKTGTVLDDSNRTSVHVHLNVQKFCLNRLTTFSALWFSFEELLALWAGEHRVGNLFCMMAKDAPAIVNKLRRWIKSDANTELSDGLHYAGFNVNALHKFGSIEIRYLRGCTDKQHILDWVRILRRLYDMSAEFPDPRDVISAFSYSGPSGYFQEMLGDCADIVRSGIDMSEENIRDSLYNGIRLAQDLAFCRDWSLYKPVEVRDDPFGRPIGKKSASSLISQAHQLINSGALGASEFSGYYSSSQPQTYSLSQVMSQVEAIPMPPSPPAAPHPMELTPVQFGEDNEPQEMYSEPEPEWFEEEEPEYDDEES